MVPMSFTHDGWKNPGIFLQPRPPQKFSPWNSEHCNIQPEIQSPKSKTICLGLQIRCRRVSRYHFLISFQWFHHHKSLQKSLPTGDTNFWLDSKAMFKLHIYILDKLHEIIWIFHVQLAYELTILHIWSRFGEAPPPPHGHSSPLPPVDVGVGWVL